MLSLTDALAIVKRNCAPTVTPTLSDADITNILTDDLAMSVWLPATAYVEDQLVVPTVPMGRVYRCVLPGTSDVTAPQWLIAPVYTGPVNPLGGGAWWGAGIVPLITSVTATPWLFGLADGTAAWRADAIFRGELYDVRRATYDAWMLKAQKASNDPKRKRVGALSKDDLTYEQCMQMARRYAPVGFM